MGSNKQYKTKQVMKGFKVMRIRKSALADDCVFIEVQSKNKRFKEAVTVSIKDLQQILKKIK